MRKYFIHYSVDGEAIKAVVVAESEREAISDVRKRNRKSNIVFFRVSDVATLDLGNVMGEGRS